MLKNIRAVDIMTTDVTTINCGQSVEELIQLFRVSHFTGLPVVDDNGKAMGLVSETDILRALAYTLSPPGDSSGEIALKQPERERMATTRLLSAVRRADVEVYAAVVMRELLTRTVRELMSPVLVSCRPETPLAEVCETMAWKGIHRVVVLDEEGRVVGLISALDLARRFGDQLKA